jgi:uncharacterized protein GlcG (DUF336 family)
MTISPSITQRNLTWQAAHRACEASVQQALLRGVKINVTVVDGSGIRLGFLRMNGAPLHSIDISEDKAYTAVSFGLPTHEWTSTLAKHSSAVREGLPKRARFVAFGGGLPIRAHDELIGGIGVSGGSELDDQVCAAAGISAIGLDSI